MKSSNENINNGLTSNTEKLFPLQWANGKKIIKLSAVRRNVRKIGAALTVGNKSKSRKYQSMNKE